GRALTSRPLERAPAALDRSSRHPRADRSGGLRRGRADRTAGGERHGPLPRAPGVQGRSAIRRLPQGQRDGRADGRAAERLHVPRPGRLPPDLPRRGGRAGDRSADRLRRAPAHRCRRARPRARRRHPGDRPRQRPAVGGRRAPDRPRRLRRAPARPPRPRPRGAPADVLPRGDRRLPRAPVGRHARRRLPGRQPLGAARGGAPGGALRPLPGPRRRRLRRAGARAGAAGPGGLARVQPVAPADVLPPVRRRPEPARARRAVDLLDPARRLDGLAAVRRDPRAAGPRLLGVLGRARLCRRADPAALRRPRVGQVPRSLCAHARDRRRAAHGGTARGGGRARALLHRRPTSARLREHQRGRPPRRHPGRRLRGAGRPGCRHPGARRDHLRRRRARRARDLRGLRGRLRGTALGRRVQL
ncbi:MAG: FIG007959: peptidase, M16 family, partial [uncultured Solirubrobacteraceae bacterium]